MDDVDELRKRIELIDIEISNIRLVREARGESAFSVMEIERIGERRQLQGLYDWAVGKNNATESGERKAYES